MRVQGSAVDDTPHRPMARRPQLIVTDRYLSPGRLGGGDDAICLIHRCGDGLLQKDMGTGFQCGDGLAHMEIVGGTDMDQIEFGIGQHAVHIGVTIVFWHIVVLAEFGEPICTEGLGATEADDPMLVFNLTDQVRETIQHTLYRLLSQRRNAFLG